MKLRWWFSYGQPLKTVSGAGSRLDQVGDAARPPGFLIVLALGLAYFDQLPVVLLYMMIVAMVRAAGALGQLFTHWRLRPLLDSGPSTGPEPPAMSSGRQSRPPLDASVIAVDGLDGSGKSRFAAALAAALSTAGSPASLVHVDDFRRPLDFSGLAPDAEAALYYERYFDFAALDAALAPLLARAPQGAPSPCSRG